MPEVPSSKSNPKTVFIVGAGASHEANLPLGPQLTRLIAKVLDIRFEHRSRLKSGDYRIVEALRVAAGNSDPPSRDISPFLHAGRRIHDAMPQAISIDAFIDSHRGDKHIELCGKLAIVSTILDAEAKSYMFVDHWQGDHELKFVHLENTWFHIFVQMLTENCQSSDLAQRLNSIAFIIFNYDRCVEHYLYYAIQKYYGMRTSEVAQLLRDLEIYHPYGTVGSLPWLDSSHAIDFGEPPNSDQLLRLASQIKTYTEGTDEASSAVNSIRSIMKTSDKLVFLGFAFHRSNIELLLPSAASKNLLKGDHHVFGTALHMSQSNTDSICAEFAAKGISFMNYIQIRNDLACNALLREYCRSLSFV